VKDSNTDAQLAAKTLCPGGSSSSAFLREIEALANLSHPCVLRIVGYSLPTDTSPAQIYTEFADHRSLAEVMEKAKYGEAASFWNETGKAVLICGIVLGMKYVHAKGIIHRDLKPSNILINARGEAMIGDFGSAQETWDDHTLTPEAGTVQYAAPELFHEGSVCTPKVDVYSFGLVLYEILTGNPVFSIAMSPFDVIRNIRSRQYPAVPDSCGPFMQKLINKCWSGDPHARPSFEQIFKDFEATNFCGFPGADYRSVQNYASEILEWEITHWSSNDR
jgi:serine/threonine protein kinase